MYCNWYTNLLVHTSKYARLTCVTRILTDHLADWIDPEDLSHMRDTVDLCIKSQQKYKNSA